GFENLARDIDGRSFKRIEPADAGIVDQDIDRSGRIDGIAHALVAGNIERQDEQIVGGWENIFARRAHRGDNLPIAREEIFRDIEAEARRAAGNQYGLHGEFLWWHCTTPMWTSGTR